MPTDAALAPPSAPPALWRGVVLRFAFAYWTLFCIPMISTEILGFDRIGRAIRSVWDPMVLWVGKNILSIGYDFSTADNGSGDKTSDWVGLFCVASIALVVATVWSLVDRRRAHDARLRALLRVFVRYMLAFFMLGYGVIKLLGGQFPQPGVGRLIERYGDSSPMGLMWTFMGASPAYVFFSGAGETLGAVLLLFRRTTTLGALVLAVVLTNVVMLNFCYDVPVKINSSHYLAMCVFLMLPDLGRLANVLVLQRATQPAARDRALPKRWMRVARLVIKYGVIGVVVFMAVKEARPSRSRDEHKTWYDGYWNVTAFARDGQDVPAIVTDARRWKRIKFETWNDDESYVRWHFMDDSYGDLYDVVVDEKAHTMTLAPDPDETPQHPTGPVVLKYVRADADHLELEGKVGAENLAVKFERFDPGDMLLMTRGFHWISEAPFNR